MSAKAAIVLQARTTSSRLPGKALLPVGGYPCVALAALRAANRGMHVIIATSYDSSDDQLQASLTRYGFKVARGPLQDVLKRFVQAIESLHDDTCVVRLTGDNIFPDGDFITELLNTFENSECDYLDSASPQNRLPYGLSAEVFRARDLREADRYATTDYDREHVTPWIRRHRTSGVFVPEFTRDHDFSHLRCTIDDREDYERAQRVFACLSHPVQAGWRELVRRLADLPGEPRFRVPYREMSGKVHSEITLGTAQLGMPYGIANRTGRPSDAEAIQIVRTAIAHGVTAIDTARAYEQSESVIGRALSGAWRSRAEVITKLDFPVSVTSTANCADIRNAVDASVNQSRQELQTETIQVLLLHSWAHYRAWNGEAWSRLRELRDIGIIGELGVSVYDPDEAQAALHDPEILHLQIPFNLLDWRWRAAQIDQLAQQRPEVELHARSALLQGALVSPPEQWPIIEGFDAAACVRRLEELVRSMGRESIADLCFAYVRSQSWVQSTVVGCETLAQLQKNLDLFCKPKLGLDQCHELDFAFPDVPSRLLNPAHWSL